jgi:hypothetical protein
MAESETRVSRETRLLILVIGIAVVVLFVLAYFRFPGAEVRLATVTPAGLDRLAAKASYDDLAVAIQTAMQGVEQSVVVFDLEGTPEGSKQPEHRRAQLIRLRDGLGVGVQPLGFKVAEASGAQDGPIVRALDPRGLVIAVLTSQNSPGRTASVISDYQGFSYVAVVEPATGGPTASPQFIGRLDVVRDEKWRGDLLVPGGSNALPVGSLIFLLDGRFIGLVVRSSDGVHAIAPAVLLTSALDAIERSGGEEPR